MSKRIDREEQRLMCLVTDANARVYAEVARLLRAANRLKKARDAARRAGVRLTKRRQELARAAEEKRLNGKDGAP